MVVIEFLLGFAVMQLSHVFVIAATDGEWSHRQFTPIALAVILDITVLVALISA